MAKKKLEAIQVVHDFPDWILHSSLEWKGRWHELFGRKAPLHLEVGMGFGSYLIARAEAEPHRNFLGIDRQPYRVMTAFRKAREKGLINLRFLCGPVHLHLLSFEEGELDEITLLFPDPWPAGGQRKQRLTYPPLVELYHRILRVGGKLVFRTDHPRLYDYSKPILVRQGFALLERLDPERILTDFEQRYLAEGRPIYALEASKTQTMERSHNDVRIDAPGTPSYARCGSPLHEGEPESGSASRGVKDPHGAHQEGGAGQLPVGA